MLWVLLAVTVLDLLGLILLAKLTIRLTRMTGEVYERWGDSMRMICANSRRLTRLERSGHHVREKVG